MTGFHVGVPGRRSVAPRRVRSDRGSVSLLVAAVVAALIVLSMGAADVARVLHTASKAQTAADAAALAAAQALAIDEEGPAPMDLASEYAAHNGAALEACECEPGTFVATVSVRMPVGDLFLVGGDRTVLARARAEVDVPVP
jgi:secretion/DNA translocation related TadE-like protein